MFLFSFFLLSQDGDGGGSGGGSSVADVFEEEFLAGLEVRDLIKCIIPFIPFFFTIIYLLLNIVLLHTDIY